MKKFYTKLIKKKVGLTFKVIIVTTNKILILIGLDVYVNLFYMISS